MSESVTIIAEPYTIRCGKGKFHVDTSKGEVQIFLPSLTSYDAKDEVVITKISKDSNHIILIAEGDGVTINDDDNIYLFGKNNKEVKARFDGEKWIVA